MIERRVARRTARRTSRRQAAFAELLYGNRNEAADTIPNQPAANAEGVWFCPQCGTKNEANFCPKCGTARPEL